MYQSSSHSGNMKLKDSSGIIIFFYHYLNYFHPGSPNAWLSCREVRVHQVHLGDVDNESFLQLRSIILEVSREVRGQRGCLIFLNILNMLWIFGMSTCITLSKIISSYILTHSHWQYQNLWKYSSLGNNRSLILISK